jgi:signal peptidase II
MRSDEHQLSPGASIESLKPETKESGGPGREALAGDNSAKAGKRIDFLKLRRLLAPCALVVVLDLATKAWAMSSLSPYGRKAVTGFFNLVLVFNQGAAFSLFSGDGPYQGVMMAALALLAMAPLAWFYWRSSSSDKGLLAAMGLLLGGGAGNVHDRLRYGAVVDFLDFHLGDAHWPAFNAADAAVCVGAGLLAFSVFFGKWGGAKAEPPSSPPAAPRGRDA